MIGDDKDKSSKRFVGGDRCPPCQGANMSISITIVLACCLERLSRLRVRDRRSCSRIRGASVFIEKVVFAKPFFNQSKKRRL